LRRKGAREKEGRQRERETGRSKKYIEREIGRGRETERKGEKGHGKRKREMEVK